MENLISKAIEAIKENKTERAIGLLEGALEMSGKKEEARPIFKYKDVSASDIAEKEYVDFKMTEKQDEGSMLDRQAKAQLESVKRLAMQGQQ